MYAQCNGVFLHPFRCCLTVYTFAPQRFQRVWFYTVKRLILRYSKPSETTKRIIMFLQDVHTSALVQTKINWVLPKTNIVKFGYVFRMVIFYTCRFLHQNDSIKNKEFPRAFWMLMKIVLDHLQDFVGSLNCDGGVGRYWVCIDRFWLLSPPGIDRWNLVRLPYRPSVPRSSTKARSVARTCTWRLRARTSACGTPSPGTRTSRRRSGQRWWRRQR